MADQCMKIIVGQEPSRRVHKRIKPTKATNCTLPTPILHKLFVKLAISPALRRVRDAVGEEVDNGQW